MKYALLLLIFVSSLYGVEVLKWQGEILKVNVSIRHTTHFVFDEEIEREIYPKEENINIIRGGNDVYFRYNPFKQYKIIRKGKQTQKIRDGMAYKGHKIKIWFIGKDTGTNYALEINPTDTDEDTFYINNAKKEIQKIKDDIQETKRKTRASLISSLVKQAVHLEPISGYRGSVDSTLVKRTKRYNVTHIKGYQNYLYQIDVYLVKAKRKTVLTEFQFMKLNKKRKVFIGIIDGWKKPLKSGQETIIVIVSRR